MCDSCGGSDGWHSNKCQETPLRLSILYEVCISSWNETTVRFTSEYVELIESSEGREMKTTYRFGNGVRITSNDAAFYAKECV